MIDSYPMASDNLHYKADPTWDMGLQYVEAMRRLRGISARRVTQPTVVGYGTPSFNLTTLAPRGYPLSVHGDLELLFVGSMKNSGGATNIPTPAGWTSLQTLSQAIGGQTQKAAIFSRTLLQSDLDASSGLPPAVSIAHGNDEGYSVRVTVRGPNLFPSIDGSVVAYAATAFGTGGVNATGPTTTGTNSAVLTFVCSQGGGTSPTEHMTDANATTAPALVVDAPLLMNTTNYGLLALFAGVKATPGATGTDVVTPSITANPSGFRLAVKS